jgi:inosine/xanthosine triphosphatase
VSAAALAAPRGTPLATLRRVRVGSTSPPKVEAVRAALAPFAPRALVEGAAVASGVSEQPVGFEEITAGALARARAAFALGGCDLAVGYEDGLVELRGAPERWFNVGCAAVADGARSAVGFSSGFAYPPRCTSRAVAEREPIGALFDALWADGAGAGARPAAPSARGLGNVGKLTNGALTRADYARQAVLCALVSFLHPELYAAPGGPP